MLNTSETVEMHDPSSSSDEEEWDTDKLANNSINSESFSLAQNGMNLNND